ncbi:alpha/beta fold hydrolase [Motilibacter sp. E257]|uniref:Alpha/beta fold hydrolase n=1 Tax=Motilibacter deserti TaxID=2714956 RepID=A0ABX0GPS3_9ACTN|nr:alpha/beta fold hydrolase [Motilibacter deserti]
MTLDVDGAPVHVTRVGSGPPVLLLHGSGPGTTGWGAWRATAEALSDRLDLVVPDQAGFGATPVPGAGRAGREVWVAQAAGVMAGLGLERYAVVGHSMGGAVALALAAAEPERVTALVGVASMGAPAPLSPGLDRLWAARPTREDARALLELLFDDAGLVTEAAVDARLAAMTAGEEAYSRLFPPPRDRWAADLALTPAELAAVRARTLFVHGAQDRVTPLPETGQVLAGLVPGSRLEVLEDCGHVPAVEHPARFRGLLTGFLLDGE